MKAVKRIVPHRCCGVIVDLQGFFLAQVDKRLRSRIKTNTSNFVRLLNYFQIPIVVTLERPVDSKGSLPKEIGKHLGDRARTFEKDFFDLCKEKTIRAHLAGLKRQQAIVAGCETDVCVLQSCLGLLSLGYEVYVIEELIFSSSRNTDAAIARMQAAGVVFTSYKTLFYELIETVGGDRHTDKLIETFGPLPRRPAGFGAAITVQTATALRGPRSSAAMKCARSSVSVSPRGSSTWRSRKNPVSAKPSARSRPAGWRFEVAQEAGQPQHLVGPRLAGVARHRPPRFRRDIDEIGASRRSPRIAPDRARSRARPAAAIRSAPPAAPPAPDLPAGRGFPRTPHKARHADRARATAASARPDG